MIALSGVPAPYLGYMDVVELREQLVHANVSFSTEIIDIQENVNEGMSQIFDIIADFEGLGVKPSDYYTISLIPPISLILQLIEMTMSSVGNILSVCQTANIDFDPYYFLQKYVPHIDWDDFKKNSEEYKRKLMLKSELQSLNRPPEDQDPGMGMRM